MQLCQMREILFDTVSAQSLAASGGDSHVSSVLLCVSKRPFWKCDN